MYKQQPGESYFDMIQRRSADYAAYQREQDERRNNFVGPRRPCNSMFPVNVGNYDCNGNPKGSGWS